MTFMIEFTLFLASRRRRPLRLCQPLHHFATNEVNACHDSSLFPLRPCIPFLPSQNLLLFLQLQCALRRTGPHVNTSIGCLKVSRLIMNARSTRVLSLVCQQLVPMMLCCCQLFRLGI